MKTGRPALKPKERKQNISVRISWENLQRLNREENRSQLIDKLLTDYFDSRKGK